MLLLDMPTTLFFFFFLILRTADNINNLMLTTTDVSLDQVHGFVFTFAHENTLYSFKVAAGIGRVSVKEPAQDAEHLTVLLLHYQLSAPSWD